MKLSALDRAQHGLALLFVLCVALTACGRSNSGGDAAKPAAEKRGNLYLDHPQPRLSTVKLWLGTNELEAEIARTTAEVATGMMYRTNMAENEAMLFVFQRPFQASFYMRNTKIPLSCAYIDPEGIILEIHDLKPLEESPVMAKSDQVQYVLETTQGWFNRNHVAVGSLVRTPQSALGDFDWRTLRPGRVSSKSP